MILHERIVELREDKDWTQEKLARRLHVSRSSVLAYEQGVSQPSCEVLLQLAELFDVSLDYLMGRTHDRRQVLRGSGQ